LRASHARKINQGQAKFGSKNELEPKNKNELEPKISCKKLGNIMNGHLTAIKRNGASAPLKMFLKNKIFSPTSSILDYGCGHGADARALEELGFSAVGYDPHWAPHVELSLSDYITCTYVFNVVPKGQRPEVILKIKNLLKPNGKALITVRRDFCKDYMTKKGPQFNVTLNLPTIFTVKGKFETYLLQN